MPRMGEIAGQDEYGYSDLGVPIGAIPGEESSGWGGPVIDALQKRPYDPTVVATTASPLVTITEGDIGRATEAALGVSSGGLSTRIAKAPKAEAVVAKAPKAEATKPLDASVDTSGWANAPYIIKPQRILKPGIYKDPRVIAAEANARVAPEHPALKELFGVTRDDLYEISKQGTRKGNVEPNIWFPNKPGSSEASENIMTPANAQRLIDTLTEARKYPGLERGMIPWYVMDPAFKRMVELVGPERAITEYRKFNEMMTPFSASSNVLAEINRGTGARYAHERGRLGEFAELTGMPVEKRPANFPAYLVDVMPHLRHGEHIKPVQRWAETGKHGYDKNTVKIPLYTQASGVPETGFQTSWAVPDAHFARAVGMGDTRTNATPGNFMAGPEYRTMSPWFRENVAQRMGIESVPSQALTWGAYAPQTGVKTPIGAGKLELISQRMWERAKQLGVDPHTLRDKVLLGDEYSALEDDENMGSVASLSRYG